MGGFTKWALSWPEQAVLAAHSIAWSSGAEAAIVANNKDYATSAATNAVKDFSELCAKQLEEIVSLVRTAAANEGDKDSGGKATITVRDRKTLRSLIIVSVHARDVVDRLLKSGVRTPASFEWASNLRYYSSSAVDPDEGAVKVEMVTTRLDYAFEYLGNYDR